MEAIFNDWLHCANDTLDINQIQDHFQRNILHENPSRCVAFASPSMSEPEFIRAVARRPHQAKA
jgi:uncharacterized protein (UPF0276 family)